jgi:hypothetical protein
MDANDLGDEDVRTGFWCVSWYQHRLLEAAFEMSGRTLHPSRLDQL